MKNLAVSYEDTMTITKLLKIYLPDIQTANHAVATKFKETFDCKLTEVNYHREYLLEHQFVKGILRILYNDDIIAYFYKDSFSSRLVLVNDIVSKYRNEITDIFKEFVTRENFYVSQDEEDKIYNDLVKEFKTKELENNE